MAFKLLAFLGLTSCNQNSSHRTDETISAEREVFTLYSKGEKIIHAARVLTTDNSNFELLLYDVDISISEGAKQKFVSAEKLNQLQLGEKKTDLQKTFSWRPFKKSDVLFVQIQPKGFKDEMELLDKRQDIEDEIDSTLEVKNLVNGSLET